jgi:hypothetical protein
MNTPFSTWTLLSRRWRIQVPPKQQYLTITQRHISENKSSLLILYTFRHTYCFIATNCTVQVYCPTVYTSTCFGNLQPPSPSHHCDVDILSQSAVYSEVQYTIVKTLSNIMCVETPFQWPHGLRRRSAAARLLRSWVRIRPGGMDVCLLRVLYVVR